MVGVKMLQKFTWLSDVGTSTPVPVLETEMPRPSGYWHDNGNRHERRSKWHADNRKLSKRRI